MSFKRVTTIIVFSAIVFGALFASQALSSGMQMHHESMGQADMDSACAVHCFIEATDDVEAASLVTLVVTVVFALALFSFVPEPRSLDRLVPVDVSYRDPRLILTIQKRE